MKRFAALVGALALALPVTANADTVTLNHVLDPALISTFISQDTLAMPFNLGVGDTLDFTLTFTGGQSVVLTGDSYLWMVFLTSDEGGASLDTTGTYEFLGASSNVVSGPIPISQDNSFAHVGNYLFESLYRTNSAPISFSGIRQIITINGVVNTDPDNISTSRDYASIALATDGRIGAIPEPGTWALMIGGFGLAGAWLRRRRAVVAA